MAPRIIKEGTARASSVRQFSFLDSAADVPAVSQSLWPEVPYVPAAKIIPFGVEPSSAAAADGPQLEKSAFENGYAQGEKAGLELAEKKVESVMKRYAEAILEVNKLRPFLYAQVEREVVKLALEVAKKILHREVSIDPDIVQTLMRVALSHVAEKSAVTIHLNPEDYNYLQQQRAELTQAEGRSITLLPDKSTLHAVAAGS